MNETQNIYQLSAEKLLRDARVDRGDLALLSIVLRRLPEAFAAKHPFEVLAIQRVEVVHNAMSSGRECHLTLLALRGWGLPMTLQVWKAFRMAFPLLRFDPEVMRLLTRDQLQDEYGALFGSVLADVCADADSQPLFNALLFRQFDMAIPRPAVKIATNLSLPTKPEDSLAPLSLVACRQLAYTEAGIAVHELVGFAPSFLTDLDPRVIDYEIATSEAEADLRPPHGDGPE